MNAISSAELAQIRTDAALAACDLPCIIQRKTPTKDAYGTTTDVYTTVNTTTAGMKQPTAGMLANYAYIIESLATWLIQLPYSVTVQHQDHLIIQGETLEVQVLLGPQSYDALTTLLATELK